jgi:4-hydroxybenzoate polyprenyltransferase
MLAGRVPGADVLAFAFLTAMATYLLDRVKLCDADLDPADTMSHPARAAFMRRHSGLLRGVVLLASMGAVAVAFVRAPLDAVLVPLALGGVLFYARSRERHGWRLKDVLELKNLSVAGGITSFALFLLLVHDGAPVRQTFLDAALPAVFLFQNVFADALLCDVDDRESDARYGTNTIPVRFGERRAVAAAVGVKASSALWPALLAIEHTIGWPGATVWMMAPTVLTLVIVRTCRGNYRDAVDLALAPICVLGSIAMRM